jgi:RNA polymerase sigma-70 factor (ECF subfamily)
MDQTDMGGAGETFLTTHWSLIEDIRLGKDEDPDRALISLLIQRYWKPVYCYLRRKGHGNEQAKDLTQGFFHEVVLNRHLVEKADQSKGRFRSFLLVALNRYVSNVRAKQITRKHIPPHKLVSLEIIDPPAVPRSLSDASPEESYNYVWLSTLLDQVLSALEIQCRQDGLDTHWQVFYDRIVQPALHNTIAPSLAEVCEKYQIKDQKKASNMAITVRKRFQASLRHYLRSTVLSDTYLQEELQEMMQFFAKGAQPPS